MNSDSLRRISIQGTLAHGALNLRKTCFAHTSLFVDPNIPRSCVQDTRVNARTCTRKAYLKLHSPESPHACVENDSYELVL